MRCNMISETLAAAASLDGSDWSTNESGGYPQPTALPTTFLPMSLLADHSLMMTTLSILDLASSIRCPARF
jgi:hypothetical protein